MAATAPSGIPVRVTGRQSGRGHGPLLHRFFDLDLHRQPRDPHLAVHDHGVTSVDLRFAFGPRLRQRQHQPALRQFQPRRHVEAQHRNFGEFRVPSLREAARTAPYMHNVTLATLEDMVRFYSELDEERLLADGEKILRPLHLTAQESADLLAFLQSLSSTR